MTLGNNLTLLDYMGNIKPLYQQGISSDPGASPSGADFGNILTSLMSKIQTPTLGNMEGLTLSDYRANPVKIDPRVNNYHAALDLFKTDTRHMGSSQANRWRVPSNPGRGDSYRGVSAEEVSRGSRDQRIDRSIKRAAKAYDLPVSLLKGVVKAESDFQVRAQSSAGAQGLMQLMPETAREMGVTDTFNIEQNIAGGARYLRKMLDDFGNLKSALAAYNAGPGTVRRYNGEIPPFKETIHYVDRVLRYSAGYA
jgi:hypothetical protein